MSSSRLEKYCFLCNVKGIDGNYLIDSQESSIILCNVLNVSHLMNYVKNLENITYCHPCNKRILKIHESSEILRQLEKEVLEEKYLIELQLEKNYKVVSNELHYSPWDFGVKLVKEMRFKSIESKLKKVFKNRVDRKFYSKTKYYRIMKNITISDKLKNGTFVGHISKELTTPLIYNIISTETKPFISNDHFVDYTNNSPFNHVELPLTPHVYDFDEIKLELLSEETNNINDIKDPFEGIVPESSFVPENSTTQKTITCVECENNFDECSQLDEPSCTHIASKSFRFCPNEFVSKVSLNTNAYIHVKNIRCRFCVKVFPDRFSLTRHERFHTGEKPFKCSYCEKLFYLQHSVKIHERIHTGEKPFKCGYCDKTFPDRGHMKRHELIHSEEKQFKCGYCDKTFRHRSNWKSHERIHTVEKLIKCRYCDKKFRDPGSMKRHESLHAAVKNFKCKFCEETFLRKSGMEVHERIHTNEKPFKCGYCAKTFRDPSHMKRHEFIHETVKPFKCKFCEESFVRRDIIIRHERSHTVETPFKCKHCDRSFRTLFSIKRHENTHKKKHFKWKDKKKCNNFGLNKQ